LIVTRYFTVATLLAPEGITIGVDGLTLSVLALKKQPSVLLSPPASATQKRVVPFAVIDTLLVPL